jgi:hypothetical protein
VILTILRERDLEIDQPIGPAPARVERAVEREEVAAAGEGEVAEPEAAAEAPTKRRRLRRQREES